VLLLLRSSLEVVGVVVAGARVAGAGEASEVVWLELGVLVNWAVGVLLCDAAPTIPIKAIEATIQPSSFFILLYDYMLLQLKRNSPSYWAY